jgi:hypothetical protein
MVGHRCMLSIFQDVLRFHLTSVVFFSRFMMALPHFHFVQDELPRCSRRATAELSRLYPGTRRRKSEGPGVSNAQESAKSWILWGILKSCNGR